MSSVGNFLWSLGLAGLIFGLTTMGAGALTPSQQRSYDENPNEATYDGRNWWRRHWRAAKACVVVGGALLLVGSLLRLVG